MKIKDSNQLEDALFLVKSISEVIHPVLSTIPIGFEIKYQHCFGMSRFLNLKKKIDRPIESAKLK